MIHISTHIRVDYSNVMKKVVSRNFYIKVISLIIHLTVGKHQRLLERVSLRDTGMRIFASKLERVSHRELVSIALENTTNFTKQISHILNLTEG